MAKSKALECYEELGKLRELIGMPCKGVLHHGCIMNVPSKVGQGVIWVNDLFAIKFGEDA